MDITTKYNIGDRVYYLIGRAIYDSEISGIRIEIYKKNGEEIKNVEYWVLDDVGDRTEMWEGKLFSSHKEVGEALVKDFEDKIRKREEDEKRVIAKIPTLKIP